MEQNISIKRRVFQICFLSLMVFVTLLILLSNNRQVSASEQNLLEINRTDLEVGEVILVGNQNKDGDCEIDPFKIQTTAISASENKSWLGILLDASKCQVIVNAKWEGTFDSGPLEIITPSMNY